MKTLVALAAALSATAFVTSVSAVGLNTPAPGATAQRAAPGDLGMAIMSAVVTDAGALARGEGATAASPISTGVYEVRFGRDITACSWIGALGRPDFVGSGLPSTIFITGRNGTVNGLFVQTFDSTAAAANRSFHVVVYCGR